MPKVSIAPTGEQFLLPGEEETKAERQRLRLLIEKQKKRGRNIVTVQGLGFVGAIMAGVIADAQKEDGQTAYFTIGIQRPSVRSYWKIPTLNSGKSPIKSEDPKVSEILQRTVREKESLVATWVEDIYEFADIIVVDIQLDIQKVGNGKASEAFVDLNDFQDSLRTIGRYLRPNALILIESTVPPGTSEKIVYPILKEEFEKRGINAKQFPPLIAHAYERVMPGKNYVDSIKNYYRTYSAVNKKAEKLAKEFLETVLNTQEYPLWKLDSPTASEIAKVLENSYRAVNIALIFEWALFAEEIGVNLFEVIDSIRVRQGTHDNMMYPGFGVGGYCLPKDPCLANWASKSIFDRTQPLTFSMQAVDVNDLMPMHTFDLVINAFDDDVKDKKIAILGASYQNDVGDTRNSPTEVLYDALGNAGARLVVHDPYILEWSERPDIKFTTEITSALNQADGVVFVVRHKQYLDLEPLYVLKHTVQSARIIDAFNILNDTKMKEYKKAGCTVKGVGKGHINSL